MEVNEVQVQLDKMKAETKRLAALKQESKVRVRRSTPTATSRSPSSPPRRSAC